MWSVTPWIDQWQLNYRKKTRFHRPYHCWSAVSICRTGPRLSAGVARRWRLSSAQINNSLNNNWVDKRWTIRGLENSRYSVADKAISWSIGPTREQWNRILIARKPNNDLDLPLSRTNKRISDHDLCRPVFLRLLGIDPWSPLSFPFKLQAHFNNL